jgi:CRP/FNR family transcriptional regulator, cyclic AMP receptor protein
MGDFMEMLEPRDRDALLAMAHTRTFAPGQELITEDEPVRHLMILRSGVGQVMKNHLGGRVPLRRVRAGEVLGELSFADEQPASASVVAHEPIEADLLDAAQLRRLLASDQALGLAVYRAFSITLAQRLRSSSVSSASVPVLGIG